MSKVISPKRFINDALEAHNHYRKLHNVQPLQHDPSLSDLAQDWVEHLASNSTLQYRDGEYKNQPVGENILRAHSRYLTGQEVTDFWYKEEASYNYSGLFSANTGHFTQLVWKNTEKVGFGFAITENGDFYVAVNYFPAGNIRGEFAKNVLPKHFTNASLNNTIKAPLPFSKHEPAPGIAAARGFEDNSSSRFDARQNKFIEEAMATHNSCRARHGVPKLVHNPELSKIAQEYAEHLAKRRTLTHSTNKYNGERLGENLAYSYDSRLDFYSGEKASMQWYDEIKDHNFSLDYQPGTGHFTQLVWKTTKEVGFGVAKASDGSFYAVANYFPAGNLIGTFMKNVPRPV